ncbi:MAG: hypothetical protein ABW077_09415 [Candidatus Thiodiazotropha endolucinida]
MTPPEETLLEAQIREAIDRKLTDAGWVIQDKKRINLYESLGVAVREMNTHPAAKVKNIFYHCALFQGNDYHVALSMSKVSSLTGYPIK